MSKISDNEKDHLTRWLNSVNLSNMDLEKIITALTHPSYKGIIPGIEDYERLEFLGDAVINLITAENLVISTELTEGAMTEKRMAVVNNDFLGQIYDILNIQPLIRTQLNYTMSKKDKANFVESIFGAVFLDKGYDECKALWFTIREKVTLTVMDLNTPPLSEDLQFMNEIKKTLQPFYAELGLVRKNAKVMLQELCQKQNLPLLEYEQIERTGPDHDPIFTVKVTGVLFQSSPDTIYSGIGMGKSKKTAEFKAAENLCDQIFLEYISS